jgi:hypothetical protein
MPASVFTVANSPITTSGTLTVDYATQTANTIFAGPSTGAAAKPGFRALQAADIPNLAASKITSGQIALAQGGTGADLSGLATNQLVAKASTGALTGIVAPSAANTFLKWDGSAFSWGAPSSSGVNVQQAGSTVSTGASTINFTGAGVTVTDVSGVATVNIAGGGAGGSVPSNVPQWYKFKVNFGTTYIASIDEVPAGWTITASAASGQTAEKLTVLNITTTLGKPALYGTFYAPHPDNVNMRVRQIGNSQLEMLTNISNNNQVTINGVVPSTAGAQNTAAPYAYAYLYF